MVSGLWPAVTFVFFYFCGCVVSKIANNLGYNYGVLYSYTGLWRVEFLDGCAMGATTMARFGYGMLLQKYGGELGVRRGRVIRKVCFW